MRIRSIRPEFWRSDDIDALDWSTRLLFIGLWSYVDDNGVGVDKISSIVADLFAADLEANPRDTLATVSRGLQTLSAAGLITRYTVSKKHFLHINTWDTHQRIDRPAKSRYPLPTCDDAEIARPSRDPRDTPSTGEGEKGRRGEGNTPAPATPSRETEPDRFAEFWGHYPKKKDRGHAHKAWKAATKDTDPQEIINGLLSQLPALTSGDPKFIPYGATWLNGQRWDDEITTPAPASSAKSLALLPKCPDCNAPQEITHYDQCTNRAWEPTA